MKTPQQSWKELMEIVKKEINVKEVILIIPKNDKENYKITFK